MSAGLELRLPPTERHRLAASASDPAQKVRTLAEAERVHILEALRQVNWVIVGRNGAASRLGLPRTTLIYRMRKLGIKAERIDALGNAVAEPSQSVNYRDRKCSESKDSCKSFGKRRPREVPQSSKNSCEPSRSSLKAWRKPTTLHSWWSKNINERATQLQDNCDRESYIGIPGVV